MKFFLFSFVSLELKSLSSFLNNKSILLQYFKFYIKQPFTQNNNDHAIKKDLMLY